MKFIKKLRYDLKEYLFELFEINKVFNQLDDIHLKLKYINDDLKDIQHSEILDFDSNDFVSSLDYDSDIDDIKRDISELQDYDLDNISKTLDGLCETVDSLQDEVTAYRIEQAKLKRAMKALCMTLGKSEILKILEEDIDE